MKENRRKVSSKTAKMTHEKKEGKKEMIMEYGMNAAMKKMKNTKKNKLCQI